MGKLWAEQARLNLNPLFTDILFKSSWPENFGAELPTGSRMDAVKDIYSKFGTDKPWAELWHITHQIKDV